MTVQFIRPYNGYTVGQSVNFDAVTESSLVLQGIAVALPYANLTPAYNFLNKSGVAVNFKKSNTAQMSAIMAGNVHSYLISLGDSWQQGFGTGTGGTGNNNAGRLRGVIGQVVAQLNKINVPASYASYCGTGIGPTPPTAANADLWHGNSTHVGSSGFLTAGGFDALGAYLTSIITAGTDGLDLNFQKPFDTVDCLYAINTTHGNLTLAADGGAVQQTINTAGSPAYGFSSLTVSGLNTLNIRNTVAQTYPCAFVIRENSKPRLNVLNCSVGGIALQTLAIDPASASNKVWATRAGITSFLNGVGPAKKVVLLNGWYNDKTASRSIAQAQADLATLITTIKAAGGEPWYLGYSHLSPASILVSDFNSWYDGMLSQCVASDIPAIDLRPTRESFNTGNQQGLYYDALHNNGVGATEVASSFIVPCFQYASTL